LNSNIDTTPTPTPTPVDCADISYAMVACALVAQLLVLPLLRSASF